MRIRTRIENMHKNELSREMTGIKKGKVVTARSFSQEIEIYEE